MSLEQLESAIVALPPDERWRLAEWFEEHLSELLGEDDLSEEQKEEILHRRVKGSPNGAQLSPR